MLSTTSQPATRPFSRRVHLQVAWYAAGAVVAFLLPFVFSSLLDLGNDLYYAIYFAGITAFLASYAVATRLDVAAAVTRYWKWSLGLGVVAAAFVVFSVLSREDATDHPSGLYFAFAILWRGFLYGAIDALVLTAFPAAVAYALFGGRVSGLARRAGFGAVTLVLVLVITATYHLGYEQFREDGVAAPEVGNTIISVPAIVTTNPVGSIVAHSAMHVVAVVHAYETDVYLPPQTDAD